MVRRRRGLSVGIRGSYSLLLRSRRAGRCVQGLSGLDAKTYVIEPDEDFVSMLMRYILSSVSRPGPHDNMA